MTVRFYYNFGFNPFINFFVALVYIYLFGWITYVLWIEDLQWSDLVARVVICQKLIPFMNSTLMLSDSITPAVFGTSSPAGASAPRF